MLRRTAGSPGGGAVDISLAWGWIELPHIVHPADEVVIRMRPVNVFAKDPGREIEQLRAEVHGRWRQAARAVMVLLSLHGLAPSQIAELLDCHPATVRRWISRFNAEGIAGLADRPRSGRPGWAGAGWRAGSPRCSSGRARRPCRGSAGTWAGRGSARGRCTGGSGWSRSGGGPS